MKFHLTASAVIFAPISHPLTITLLFATGLTAGFVDSIAGGGGLITLPVLLSLGMEPKLALGTNKLQATAGSGSAAWHYGRAKLVDLRDCVRGFGWSLAGSVLGTLAVERVDSSFLKRAIPILLIVVATYVLLRPRLGVEDVHPRMRRAPFDMLFGLGIGFYDGFFGPGTGTFWTMAFIVWAGFNLAKATGYSKVVNFASNLGSLTFFLLGGQVLIGAGLVMAAGQFLGARIGARMVITRGTKFVRPVFLTVVFALAIKLLYDAYLKH